jgi:hypothetical protein
MTKTYNHLSQYKGEDPTILPGEMAEADPGYFDGC